MVLAEQGRRVCCIPDKAPCQEARHRCRHVRRSLVCNKYHTYLCCLMAHLELTLVNVMLVCMLDEVPVMGCAGDMNCAHTELDIHNPKSNLKSAGFTPVRRLPARTA